jgi:transcriptional regulator with XRE-family HTH domain
MEQMPNRIRELRKARGMTLEQLGDRIGCGVTMMSDLERGQRELSYYWMQKLAKVLKVQAADLFLEKDNSKSLTAPQRELVDLYDRADDQQRAQMLQMARIIAAPRPAANVA